jgi:arylsulfatase
MGLPRVLDPPETNGLPGSETTIAQMLKTAGYATMCIGKWHLGTPEQFLPTNRGFDEYFGVPNSIDMNPRPLLRNRQVLEDTADLTTLTQRYTQAAVDFVRRSQGSPFFLYMPHSSPHIPLVPSPAFAGRSSQGYYGDVIQEIDWSVGQVLEALQQTGAEANTLVIFTSDHGPWYQGSPGGLRGRKGDTFEGGFRVPLIARFPGRIPAGQTSEAFATALDILPTLASLTGAPLPGNPLDGVDLWPLWSGRQTDVTREAFLYFNDMFLQAVRLGQWKLHVTRFNAPMFVPAPASGRVNLPLPNPELYNVVADPDESRDRAQRNPVIIADLQARISRLLPGFPDEITGAWKGTMGCKVAYTPAGAPPIQVA